MIDNNADDQSNISFMNRQQDLRNLYREFRVAYAEMKQLPSYSDFVEHDSLDEVVDVNERDSIKTKYQLKGILKDLKDLKAETVEIQTILLIPRSPNVRIHYKKLEAKVGLILQTLNQHITRTENLLLESV